MIRPFSLGCTFMFLFLASMLCAQNDAGLPQLLPSYSEDFSDYKSYPSMCFGNAFLDHNGKLWLAACGVAGQNRLHLFQFDGYEFKVAKGELEGLPPRIHIRAMTREGLLVGQALDGTEYKLFSFDLDHEKLSIQDIPDAGSINNVFLNHRNQVIVVSVTGKAVVAYEWKEGQLKTLGQIALPEHLWDVTEWEIFYHQDKAWLYSNKFRVLAMVDFTADHIREFDQEAFELTPSQQSSLPMYFRKVKTFGESLFFSISFKDNTVAIFQFDPEREKFISVKHFGTDHQYTDIFGDKLGNLVYAFKKNATTPMQAILEEPSGRRFDYSAFFADSRPNQISELVSPDFKKQLLVCTNTGVIFHRVKASEAIETVLKDRSIRAMVELPDRQIRVIDQLEQQVILDLNELQYEIIDNQDCQFYWARMSRDDSGFIWAIDGREASIVKTSIADGTCRKIALPKTHSIFTEMGDDHLILLYPENDDQAIVQKFDKHSEVVSPLLINGEPLVIDGFIHNLHYSNKQVLYAVTSNGLYQFDLKNQTREIIGLEPPFIDPRFLCIYEDDRGRLWLGTPIGGLHIYDPDTKALKIINSESGLGNNTVASIIQDDDGDFWIGTYNGVSIVSPEGEIIANLFEEDGLVHREANRYATLKTSDGKILLGTLRGLNVIDPEKLKARISKNEELKIYLTSIKYFDPAAKTDRKLEHGLNSLGTVTLPAARRNIQLSFATSNYFKPLNNQYAYRLEGIDDDWNPIGSQHILNLNNLPAGKYRLLIIGSDDKGNWTKEPLAINLHVKAFFYRQLWFYVLVSAFFGGLALLWISQLRTEVKHATKRIREDKETIERQAEELKALDKAKSRFFTNISHEFRTPLTVISGMAGQIRGQENLRKLIQRNSGNLLHLVNQILDLRKLETSTLDLQLIQGDIVFYLRYLLESFHSLAENKGIKLHFLSDEPEFLMDFDKEKILRIVSNLLSNAIKFTPENGNVYLRLTVDDTPYTAGREEREASPPVGGPRGALLLITVSDTGIGIAKDKLSHIFNRFYQVASPDLSKGGENTQQAEGTGIGLSLTKELVNLMEGEISVKSKTGEGTTFTVRLPVRREAELELQHVKNDLAAGLSSMSLPAAETGKSPGMRLGTESEDRPTLLIIEDNSDVVVYLESMLEDNYEIRIAGDGQEGIDLALELIPDLILSDVMMPRKDGFEVCETLKTDLRTSHIPIVLLTARADVESRIAGLEHGADAYLAKPFNQRELLVRLEKLLALRKVLQERYQTHDWRIQSKDPAIRREDEFIARVRQAIENHIDDEDFAVDQLCRSVGISRSQLHTKLKALTGRSTTHYIHLIRMQKAKELLLSQPDMKMIHIGMEVGYPNPAHFSRLFKKEFGLSPSEFRKQKV